MFFQIKSYRFLFSTSIIINIGYWHEILLSHQCLKSAGYFKYYDIESLSKKYLRLNSGYCLIQI